MTDRRVEKISFTMKMARLARKTEIIDRTVYSLVTTLPGRRPAGFQLRYSQTDHVDSHGDDGDDVEESLELRRFDGERLDIEGSTQPRMDEKHSEDAAHHTDCGNIEGGEIFVYSILRILEDFNRVEDGSGSRGSDNCFFLNYIQF